MSGIASASFLARRAAQRERVRILYRRALRDTLNWAVHRHLFYPDSDALRERFEANRKVVEMFMRNVLMMSVFEKQSPLVKYQVKCASIKSVGFSSSIPGLLGRKSEQLIVEMCFDLYCLDSSKMSMGVSDPQKIVYFEGSDTGAATFGESKQHITDIETIDRLIADGEASYNKWRHPDPYIVPWAPGGSKFNRNPVPPEGIEIVYDYGKEEAELV